MTSNEAANLPTAGQWEPTDKSFSRLPEALLEPQHPLHPMARGEKVCWAFAWIDLGGMARWRHGNDLLRGQLTASVSYLAKRWNRGDSWVRNFLQTLEKAGLIGRRVRGGHRPSVISIRNYDYYNGDDSG